MADLLDTLFSLGLNINEEFFLQFAKVLKYIRSNNCVTVLSDNYYDNRFDSIIAFTMALNLTISIVQGPINCYNLMFLIFGNTSQNPLLQEKGMCSSYKEIRIIIFTGDLIPFLGSPGECDIFLLPLTGLEFYRMTSPFLEFRSVERVNDTIQSWLPGTGKYPNLQERKLTVATFNCPLSIILDRDKTNSSSKILFDGIEMAILQEMSHKLNFTWELYEITDSNKWTNEGPNGTSSGGMMGVLTKQIAHIGICSIWLSIHQYPLVDLTTSWGQIKMKFLVLKAKREEKWRSILLPFNEELWMCTAIMVVLQGSLIWIFAKKKSGFSLLLSVLYTFGQLTLAHSGLKSRIWALRALVLVMSVFSLLVTSLYSGSIVSRLTAPAQSPQIETLQQMVENDFHWGKAISNSNPTIYLNMDNKWHREVRMRYKYVPNAKELTRKVLDGKFAVIAEYLEPDYVFVDQQIDPSIYPLLHITRETIIRFELAMALRKNSILTPSANNFIEQMKSSGIILKWRKDIVRRRGKNEVKKLLSVEVATKDKSSLTLSSLQGAFFMIAISWTLAALVCFTEFIVHKLKTPLQVAK